MWSSYTPGSSLENHTRFQTKIGEVYTRFRRFSDQNAAKTPVPLGWHIPTYMAYIGESPLPRDLLSANSPWNHNVSGNYQAQPCFQVLSPNEVGNKSCSKTNNAQTSVTRGSRNI